jgi:trimeric autotransporter adhesin
MKKITLTAFLYIGILYKGQVGIGTSTPNTSAILHLQDPHKGLLITSVALNSITDNTTITSPPTGLLVWNNGTGSLTTKGFYYWNDNKWNLLSASGVSSSTGWNTTGDNIGNYGGASTNLSIGTAAYDDFVIKTNGKITQRLSVNGAVNIGENSSASYQALAIGMNAQSGSNNAAALGINANAAGYQSLAIGYNAKTNSNNETAIGINTVTNNQNSTAIGPGASATGQSSTAIGYGASTSQANAIVLGDSNASIGIGTSTPNANTKLDINGAFKFGQKGVLQKNQILFNTAVNFSITNLPEGKISYVDVPIPTAYQPSSTNVLSYVTPDSSFDSNFSVVSSKLLSVNTIRVYLMNVGTGAQSIYYGKYQMLIIEY